MDKTIRAWCDETKRLIGFYQTSSESIPAVNSIFLSGGGALLGGLQQVFHEELRLDVQYHNPFRKLKVDENQFQKEYLKEIAPQMVVPFGLALRGV
jgi:type IV pilus assembly protein PilM